jgi:hypothetical protein
VKANALEGLVAKRRDSRYEPGQRSGAWQKMRVTGGAAICDRWVHALVQKSRPDCIRILRGRQVDARKANPQRVHACIAHTDIQTLHRSRDGDLPFANVRETTGGRWGEGLTAEKMAECRWLTPALVGSLRSWNGRRMGI